MSQMGDHDHGGGGAGCVGLEQDTLFELVGRDGELLVRVEAGGDMTFGPTYRPTAAAQTFWAVLMQTCPAPHFRPLSGYSDTELQEELASRRPN